MKIEDDVFKKVLSLIIALHEKDLLDWFLEDKNRFDNTYDLRWCIITKEFIDDIKADPEHYKQFTK